MKIKGFQKLSLIDYPGKIACTIFIYGCNFRCGFCHNPELVLESSLKDYSQDEILDFLDKRKNYLNGVCITGGEPLINLEKDFVKKLKEKGFFVKIDTNGSFPEKLKEFIDEKLVDFVSMDIKSSKEKYSEVVGVQTDLKKIEESMKLISQLSDYEFRTTVVNRFHDNEEIKKITQWLNSICENNVKKFVLQGFKNNGKFIDKSFEDEKDIEEEFLAELKNFIKEDISNIVIRV